MQSDPVGTKDDLNLYAYAGNDSINRSDAMGSCAKENQGEKVPCEENSVADTVQEAVAVGEAGARVAGEVVTVGEPSFWKLAGGVLAEKAGDVLDQAGTALSMAEGALAAAKGDVKQVASTVTTVVAERATATAIGAAVGAARGGSGGSGPGAAGGAIVGAVLEVTGLSDEAGQAFEAASNAAGRTVTNAAAAVSQQATRASNAVGSSFDRNVVKPIKVYYRNLQDATR